MSDVKRQAMIWTGVVFAIAIFLWLLSDILLPFVAGLALAYFLDPLAETASLHVCWARART